jgi:hypothetical protein
MRWEELDNTAIAMEVSKNVWDQLLESQAGLKE